jgi:cellulose synthase/poly-beta-1,6-N-acetylglucosamine synthase-like glycosyltransferase
MHLWFLSQPTFPNMISMAIHECSPHIFLAFAQLTPMMSHIWQRLYHTMLYFIFFPSHMMMFLFGCGSWNMVIIGVLYNGSYNSKLSSLTRYVLWCVHNLPLDKCVTLWIKLYY